MTEHLGDHALLGDLHTAALVNSHGVLDWLCLPHFDSTPCFAALTNGDRGGSWTIGPEVGGRATRRRYRRGTLVLESDWDTPEGTVRVVDSMAPRTDAARVVRLVEGVTGRVPVRMWFQPAFDHGDRTPWLRCTGSSVSAVAGSDALWLDASVPLERVDAAVEARFTMSPGQRAGFVLTHTSSHLPSPATPDPIDLIGATERFWSRWSAEHPISSDDTLLRAAITLKALVHEPTGAVVDTPVFPTGRAPYLSDVSNAATTLRALLDAGLTAEARAWREWLLRAIADDRRRTATRYTIDGRGDPSVRNGGAGSAGELLHGVNSADQLWLTSRDPAWDLQLDLLDHLESTWDKPDDTGNLVVSKVRAWAGLDSAVRTAERHALPGPVDRWRAVRARLRAEVCAKGYDPDRNTFTRLYGSDTVDAALLIMPEVGFLPWRDVRIRGTVRAVGKDLSVPNAELPESLAPGTSLTTGFRLVTALHGTGHTAVAAALFDRLLSAGNDVGLLGEFYDPAGQDTGLTPNAASAIGMLNAAHQVSTRARSPRPA